MSLPPLPRLPAVVPRSGVSPDARRALRQLLGDVDRSLAVAFREGEDASVLARRRSEAVDRIVVHVWSACLGDMAAAALFAVGGFGRGMLFPSSDVDLLALVGETSPNLSRALENFFGCLWDIGMKPGHATRTVEQCREPGDRGRQCLHQPARRAPPGRPACTRRRTARDPRRSGNLAATRIPGAVRLRERNQRHARFDDTAHNLEPNLKDGPGGLRTLDALRWLGKRLAAAPDFDAMVGEGLLESVEAAALGRAEATLRRYRYALHLEAGRAEERLLFDYQRAIAARLGFEDEHAKNLGVEQFMQGYYRAATLIERLGVQVAERFVELLEPEVEPVAVGVDYVRYGSRLALRNPHLFLRRPRRPGRDLHRPPG